jgi:nucleoside-diphosphate-sugar epimerase
MHAIGRAAGDFTVPVVAEAAMREAPRAARILHCITKQRTGAMQHQLQGELLTDNARIHMNVLEAWRRHQPQAKFISLGSSCVYPESDKPLPETAFRSGPPHPSVRGYALAKEILAVGSETYGAQFGLSWLHCILATVFGPGAHIGEHRSHFMAALIARAVAAKHAGGRELEVWGSMQTVRDLLFITDQIEAIIAADVAFKDVIVNCTANQPIEIGQCVHAILRVLGWPARIVHPPGSFQGASYKSIDSSIFLNATGWRPRYSLEQGVREVLQIDFSEGESS